MTDLTCAVPGCDAPISPNSRAGICRAHVHRQPWCGCAQCARALARIVALHRDGHTADALAALTYLSQAEAAQVLGISAATVSYHARRRVLKFAAPAPDRHLGAQAERRDRNRARYLAVAHLPVRQAAARLGVTVNAAHAAARRYGFTYPEPPRVAVAARLVPPAPNPAPAPLPMPMAGAPAWDARRDAAILRSKGRHADLAGLAARWGLSIARVTARWHILRAGGDAPVRPSPEVSAR